LTPIQGFGSASIYCGSGSRVLNTDADPDPDTDPDPDPDTDPDPMPEFLRVRKYLINFMHFFQAFLQI